MARRIETYQQQRGLPGFQEGQTAGLQRAVSEMGRTAGAVGQMAASHGRRAAVLTKLGQLSTSVGTQLAKQAGEQRDLEPVRDEAGNLVPADIRPTLNIERQIYNNRLAEKWAHEAQVEYRRESNAAALQFRDDAAGYRKHMAEREEALLSNAPGQVKDALRTEFRKHQEAQGFTLDQVAFRKQEQTTDAALNQAVQFHALDWEKMVLRDGDKVKDQAGMPIPGRDGNVQVTEDMQDLYQRMGRALELGSNGHLAPFAKNKLGQDLTLTSAMGTFARRARSELNGAIDTVSLAQLRANLHELKTAVLDGDVSFIGIDREWDDGLTGMTFKDLPEEQQRKVEDWMNRETDRLIQRYDDKQSVDIEMMLEHQAFATTERIAASQFRMPAESMQLAVSHAHAAGVDPNLVLSMMQIESSGRAGAVAPGGLAHGLMQVAPATFAAVAADLGIRGADAMNPVHNMRVATEYIRRLQQQVLEKNPGLATNKAAVAALVTAGYYGGEGRLRSIMNREGFSPLDSRTWGEYNVNQVIDGKKMPTERQHVTKVMEQYAMVTGGAQHMMQQMDASWAVQSAHDPVLYLKGRAKIMALGRAAQDWGNYNASLTYSPPPMDFNMARQWASAQWNNNPPPQTVGEAQNVYEQISGSIAPENPNAALLMNANAERMRAAMRTLGGTSQQNAAMDQIRTSGAALGNKQTESMINKATQALPEQGAFAAGGSFNPLDSSKAMIAEMGPEGFARFYVDRVTHNGQLANGIVNRELASYVQLGLEAVAGNGLEAEETKALGLVLKNLTRRTKPREGKPIPGYSGEEAYDMFNNLAKYIGSPGGNEQGARRAMSYLIDNTGELADGDKQALQQFRDRLEGRTPSDALEYGDEDAKAIGVDSWAEQVDEGFPLFTDAVNQKIYSPAYIDPQLRNIYNEEIAATFFTYSTREHDLMPADILERMLNSGRAGVTHYNWVDGLHDSENYRIGAAAISATPYVAPQNTVMGSWEHYAGLGTDQVTITDQDGEQIQVPITVGSIEGQIQHAADSQGVELDAIGEFGKTLFLRKVRDTLSYNGYPAAELQVWQRTTGADGKPVGVPILFFDTTDLAEVQNSEATRDLWTSRSEAALAGPTVLGMSTEQWQQVVGLMDITKEYESDETLLGTIMEILVPTESFIEMGRAVDRARKYTGMTGGGTPESRHWVRGDVWAAP